jgi:predicted acylesterase/phospholipase RssA
MHSALNRIGLALSGGGFRASLYHLGLVRFLRDAGLLSRVTHITSVSGGSIVAAHLALNWDRYNGSPGEFDAAASELLAFVRLDVRNRIVRRFPLALPLRWPRRLLGRSNRRLTRTGLLEYHYDRYLYGDVSLFELPEEPALHLLATNLSEGCLCSFNRNGLLMMRRRAGNALGIDRIHIGLATVAMAVAASSAFPGFFPPLELTGADVGANVGEFGRQAYTDGGVFDNLGVRMFRCLERPLLANSPLAREDFFDFQAAVEALREAGRSSEETPLRRLAQILVASCSRPDLLLLTNARTPGGAGLQPVAGPARGEGLPHATPSPAGSNGDGEAAVLSLLGDLLRHYQFHREPLFAGLKPRDPDAEALLHATRPGGRVPDAGDQLWLNRHLLEAAFRQATGHACLRRLNSGLDGVLVSDVGKPIEVQGNRRAGGLIRTGLRATDILMDRVWQLEIETFRGTPGFVFAPITEVIEPADDPTALHPEIQRQAARVRTDIDRFSLLEISTLVRHGYCVGRKACRAHRDLFGAELPNNGPWDPIPGSRDTAPAVSTATRHPRPLLAALLGKGVGRGGEPAAATVEARTLQASALRRIWSTLLDYRDWASYVYVPILVPILVLLPYVVFKFYHHTHQVSRLIDSLTQGSPDLEVMTRLLEGPTKPWVGEPAEEVSKPEECSFAGFEVLQDSRILDMRAWNPAAAGRQDATSLVYGYRRLKVLKRHDNAGNNLFRIDVLATSPKTQVRFPEQQLQAQLRMSNLESTAPGEKRTRWQATWNFEKVPAGEYVDLIYEHISPAVFLQRGERSTSIAINMQVDTAEVTRWFLMPEGKEYKSFHILRYKVGKPETSEFVKPVTGYLADDSTIIAYKLLSADAGYTYEVTWSYK